MNKAIVFHSGGKDSMLALHRITHREDFEVVRLVTTINKDEKRSSVHAIREQLIDLQAEALQLPLEKIYLPAAPSNEIYQSALAEVFQNAEEEGVTHLVYGDIHLEDIRAFREQQLSDYNLKPIFPLWEEPTNKLMQEFLDLGYETLITSIDPSKVPEKFLGKRLSKSTVEELPKDVDPCGENGEFHTFVVDGPLFNQSLSIEVIHDITSDGFYKHVDLNL
ncbi:diphthine--ammonia ligase [Halalkalibacillus halophilus]|uniref:Dph6-related ATP pyrophosphatase n=1 Tax=Halalkalibacillus halophilus TaxID=392827 RepID=UPI00068916FC|nr:diphthine--ammonia ligase [Halalkalibacillus halophilus]